MRDSGNAILTYRVTSTIFWKCVQKKLRRKKITCLAFHLLMSSWMKCLFLQLKDAERRSSGGGKISFAEPARRCYELREKEHTSLGADRGTSPFWQAGHDRFPVPSPSVTTHTVIHTWRYTVQEIKWRWIFCPVTSFCLCGVGQTGASSRCFTKETQICAKAAQTGQ